MAKVTKRGLINTGFGSTGRKVWRTSEAGKSGFVLQDRPSGTVIMKKTDRIQHCTTKQCRQREKFTHCDLAYRKLSYGQRNTLREYALKYNRSHHTGYSMHNVWMKLCLTESLDKFFSDYLDLEIIVESVKPYYRGTEYHLRIVGKDRSFLSEDFFSLYAQRR